MNITSYSTSNYDDPGSYTPFYYGLGGCCIVLIFLFLVYGIANIIHKLNKSRKCCNNPNQNLWWENLRLNFGRSWFGPIIVLINLLVAAASCVIYIYVIDEISSLHNGGKERKILVDYFRNKWLIWSEFGFALYSLFCVALNFTLITNKWSILISINDLSSILSSVPGILGPFFGFFYWGFQFLRFAQFVTTLSTLRATNMKFASKINDMVLVVTLLASLFMAIAGFMFTFENPYFTNGILSSFFVSLYFTGVTLSTIGYGDFYPVSRPGKIAVILGLLSAFWTIPLLVASVIAPFRQYQATKSYGGIHHGVLFSRSENLEHIVSGFYVAKPKGETMLIMTPTRQSAELKSFLKNSFYLIRVKHMAGDWFLPKDVKRAHVTKANFIAVIEDKFPTDMEFADSCVIAGVLSIYSIVKNKPIYLQLHSASRRQALPPNCRTQTVCMQDLRKSILVQSCTAPGMISIINALISTVPAPKKLGKSWKEAYYKGTHCNIETTVSLAPVVGHKYNLICIALLSLISVSFIGIVNPEEGIVLFPVGRIISENDVGICFSREKAKKITKFLSSSRAQNYLTLLNAAHNTDGSEYKSKKGELNLSEMLGEFDNSFESHQQQNLTQVLKQSQTIEPVVGDSQGNISVVTKKLDETQEQMNEETTPSPKKVKKKEHTLSDEFIEPQSDHEINEVELAERINTQSSSTNELSNSSSSSNSQNNSAPTPPNQPSSSSTSTSSSSSSLREPNENLEQSLQEDIELLIQTERRKSLESNVSRKSVGTNVPVKLSSLGDAIVPILPNITIDHNKKKWKPRHARLTNLEGQLKQHIIVCGRLDDTTIDIVVRLHEKTPKDQHIVLLLSNVGDANQTLIDTIIYLNRDIRIHCLIGNPTVPFDLERTSVITSRVCLVLPSSADLKSIDNQVAHDSNSLITHHLLSVTHTFPILELIDSSNEQLIGNDYELVVAAGCLFKRTMFDTFLTQSIIKSNFISVIEKLLECTVGHFAVKQVWSLLNEGGTAPVYSQAMTCLLGKYNLLSIGIYRKKVDADEFWKESKRHSTKSSMFAQVAGAAFRSRKTKKVAKPNDPVFYESIRVAIAHPDSDLPLLKSDILFVIKN